jgi:hypothetical protein
VGVDTLPLAVVAQNLRAADHTVTDTAFAFAGAVVSERSGWLFEVRACTVVDSTGWLARARLPLIGKTE